MEKIEEHLDEPIKVVHELKKDKPEVSISKIDTRRWLKVMGKAKLKHKFVTDIHPSISAKGSSASI